ncbi:MAG: transketolase C-terminal domain-containing protein [bacterium]|nr:transketolase [bacterium]
MREIQYNQAINEAYFEEMASDESVFIIGEGVQTSTFGTMTGLVDAYGPDRVIDTPISETAIAGAALGASMLGFRPIADLMFADFMFIAADEVLLESAQWHLLHGGKTSLPLVFVANMGGYRMLGNGHSQCPYSPMLHSPGLKVVTPSTPYDAKGLLKTAIRDNNPVFYLFHKGLLGLKGDVPEGDYAIPFGEAKIRREGSDVTVLAISLMNHMALEAAEDLKNEFSVEVIDPRTLEPFDLETVITSLKKTGRLVIVDEDTERCGFAGELTAQIVEHAFFELDAPIKRVCAKNYPIPANIIERHVLPQKEEIIAAIREICV